MPTPRLLRPPLFALTLALLGLTAAAAPAQIVINSVPYTISSPGHYILTGNLNSTDTTQPAITISAANVVLDLKGFYLAGPGNTAAAPSNTNNSVIYVANVPNVTIKNGTLSGNANGISFFSFNLTTSHNYLIDSLVVTRCYLYGIYFRFGLAAPGSHIRRCAFSNIGNSTYNGTNDAVAIQTTGGVRIENNTIGGITATGGGTSYGINAGSDFCIGNTISGCDYGIVGGKNLDNLTDNCTTPFYKGTNADGND